jgi:23S rRNA maturation-related 3'-5' exoribonuclease YhaM
MKLAEVLAQRADADLQTRLAGVASRAIQHARFQEGGIPAEDPTALLVRHDRMSEELERLIVRINVQNLATGVEPDLSMTMALARRDGLRQHHRMPTDLADAAAPTQDRYTRTELRMTLPKSSTRSIRAFRK